MCIRDSSERIRLAKHAGMKVMELLEQGVCARDIVSAAAVHNAMECDMAFGGSTNTVLHLTAIAREAGHPITTVSYTHLLSSESSSCDGKSPLIFQMAMNARFGRTNAFSAVSYTHLDVLSSVFGAMLRCLSTCSYG